MKKLILFIGICMFSFSLWATGEQPTIIIHKSNGGHWAWLNLYNDILYTPAPDEYTPARLDCTGAGYSACRVPRTNMFAPSYSSAPDPSLNPVLADAINKIIEASETQGEAGVLTGSQSKKIAVVNNSSRTDTYLIKGEWRYDSNGCGTMKVYLNKSNILQRQ